MKFGVCAILKNENLYLREWVEHYIDLGFDKIILYDNNEINGEMPNVVIQDYIDAGIVDMYYCRGERVDIEKMAECTIQSRSYNECLDIYKNTLDWIAFMDIDEFIELKYYKKINHLFKFSTVYNDFDQILISSYFIGDDNKMYYENDKVQNRFKKHVKGPDGLVEDINMTFKCIVNTKSDARFSSLMPHHTMSNNICNEYGIKCYGINEDTCCLVSPNYNVIYYKHYYTKSLTEFLYKFYYSSWSVLAKDRKLEIYKSLNGWTDEHEKVYQTFLKENNIEQ